jgi:predicted DNA-binding transcriptional regulator AlpA
MSTPAQTRPLRPAAQDEAVLAPALQFLRISDVCRLLRISKPTLWRLRQRPDFPQPTLISDRVIGWSRSEIQTWIDARKCHRPEKHVHPQSR